MGHGDAFSLTGDGTVIALPASKWMGTGNCTRAWGCGLGMNSEANPGQYAGVANASGLRDAQVILEARSLRKTYGTGARSLTVLTDANLSLRRGEMVAIVAPSGAGKSTLLHLLAALDTPTSGAVYFASKPIETNQDTTVAEFRNRTVGFLWQGHQLLPGFTATEKVSMPLLLRGEVFSPSMNTARKGLPGGGLQEGAGGPGGGASGGGKRAGG